MRKKKKSGFIASWYYAAIRCAAARTTRPAHFSIFVGDEGTSTAHCLHATIAALRDIGFTFISRHAIDADSRAARGRPIRLQRLEKMPSYFSLACLSARVASRRHDSETTRRALLQALLAALGQPDILYRYRRYTLRGLRRSLRRHLMPRRLISASSSELSARRFAGRPPQAPTFSRASQLQKSLPAMHRLAPPRRGSS